ncbi:NUDIX domain-containing protein [Tunturibacter psychrotolerans]|uniref:NUDIX domain-containing protein n=1 Tax=Tunturiibacter psychrotolerans TaxID=3069686 RepID=A0AAU7ZNZ1_9BACT
MRKRRTARVMLFDEAGDVLLIRFVVPRDGGEFVFWALPGGEIEGGETEPEAAVREVKEELGLEVRVEGPVYCDRNQFLHQGEMQDNTDFLFWAKCRREEPQLMGVTADEREIMREIRWWSEEEIASSRETIFPENLAERMREQIRRSELNKG